MTVNCARQKLNRLLHDSNTYITEKDGALELSETNRYYLRVQVQLFVWQCDYCDFVNWNKDEISAQRIVTNRTFLASHLHFLETFSDVLLPKQVGQWFSRNKKN